MRSPTPGACFGALSLLFTAAACGEAATDAGNPPSQAASGGRQNAAAGAPSAGKPAAGSPAQAGTGSAGGSAAGGLGGASGSGTGGASGMLAMGGAASSASGAGGAGAAAGSGGAGGAGTGGGAGAAGSFGSGTLALTNLKIDPNPNMTISCFVSWTTPEPAASEVSFGEKDYAFRIRDATLVTDHRVLVIGMHAETAYKLRAFSGNAQGTGSAEGTFTTGKLPSALPLPKLQLDELPVEQKGWLLTNIQPASLSSPAIAVMYDEQGVPVWYFVQGTHGDTRGDVATELLPSNTVLVGPTSGEPGREVDLSGKVLWEGPANSNTVLMSHYVGKTSKGNYLLNYELDKAITNGSAKIDDQRLVEVTPKNDVVWSWNLFEHIEDSGTREELCHGNMLVLDEAADVLYYNCRWVGLFKIDRASGDVLWRMGGTYDKTSIGPGDFSFDPPESQFSDAHEPEFHADGTLLLYDNGGFAQGGGSAQKYHSRIVEYKLDQTAKKATRTFEFPGDFTGVDSWYTDTWYSPYWGDADVLANGNILVTAGVRSASASSRFFEVSRQGKVVWELVVPANNGVFKGQRLLPPPLVEKLP